LSSRRVVVVVVVVVDGPRDGVASSTRRVVGGFPRD